MSEKLFAKELEKLGLDIEAQPVPTRPGAKAWKNPEALHFLVTLRGREGEAWHGWYSAGGAHPILAAKDAAKDPQKWRTYGGSRADRQAVQKLVSFAYHGRKVFEAELIERLRDLYRPTLEDVVASLFADALGVAPYTTFREWCDDTGMGWDNPADALDSFEGCRTAANFLHDVAGEDFDKLAELAGEL